MDDAVERLRFTGGAGAELAGILHPPEQGVADGSLLFAHCFTCSKDQTTTARLAKGMAAGGFAVLRFDFTGLGDSGGDFADTTVTTDVADLVAAGAALAERGLPVVGLIGHSLGGAAAILAAGRMPSVRSVAVVNAPCAPGRLARLFTRAEPEIRRLGSTLVHLAGRRFPISEAFLDDLHAHDAERAIAGLGRPLLVIHALEDEEVPVAEGERIFAAAHQPKAFLPLLGADHLLTGRAVAQEAAELLAGWFARTL